MTEKNRNLLISNFFNYLRKTKLNEQIRMKRFFTTLIAVALTLGVMAQSKEYPSFLKKDDVALFTTYIPTPPRNGSEQFASDSIAYEEGKRIRHTKRGSLAVSDANTDIEAVMHRFAEATNLKIEASQSPQLAELIERVMNSAYYAIADAKKYFKRTRPFVYFNEPTSIPQEEESHRSTFSYPSAHAAMAWAAALVLAELLPEHQDDILQTGYEIGQSRVITGYHFQSDVDAARIAASTAVARLHADKQFCRKMKRIKSKRCE